jgi:hypothetical protein
MPASSKISRHYRQSSRRHFRSGQRAAALRALTAAKLYRRGDAATLAEAAESSGSCVAYVRAMLTLCAAENSELLARVLQGSVSLLEAAAQVERVVKLVDAYRAASATDRVQAVRIIGPAHLFDTALVPSL